MYQRYIKNYLRCVHGVDRSVGALLAWLDAHPDVKRNTIVIYSSDQGFYLGDHGWYDKRWMYEESLRMPLIVRWPEHVAAAAEIAELTQNIDFAPTFLDLAGAPIPPTMHGNSLVPLLEGRSVPWRDAIYYHYYESQAVHMVPAMYGVRTERYKLVRYYEPAVGHLGAVRSRAGSGRTRRRGRGSGLCERARAARRSAWSVCVATTATTPAPSGRGDSR